MKKRHLLAAMVAMSVTASASWAQQQVLRIGFFPGPYADQFKRGVQPYLESQGIKVQATEFSNIIQLNSALMDGALDANVFQNRAFMENYALRNAASPPSSGPNTLPLWTDDYSSMFRVLK
jgi:D-methionine transport system substrate-binding protein